MDPTWTTIDEVRAKLRKRWERGTYLSAHADGDAWQPLRVPVRGPTPIDLRDDLDGVIAWATRFRADSGEASGRSRCEVERRPVKGRGIGTNELPCAVRFASFDQLVAFLGVSSDVVRFDAVIAQTKASTPAALPWVIAHPHEALALNTIWTEMLATVNWITERDTSSRYLRHLDVPNVDTKFVERNQKVLSQLLVAVLPPGRIDPEARDFVGRFRFKSKPTYTRVRLPSGQRVFPSAVSEVRLRTDELAQVELPVSTVFVVENEVSYLALPNIPDAVIVFGEGFHSATLEHVTWLGGKEIVYWGDIDTYGFAILDRLRARFASVSSILMDTETLLAHPRQYVTEPSPTNTLLPHLDEAEASLYRDLVEDRYGQSIRLEQERIRFSIVRQALKPWGVTR